MAGKVSAGCTRPTGGPVETKSQEETPQIDVPKKETKSMVKIGQKAPDFTAAGYHKGGFINVNLSDYLGKWVALCFYPGDFTFV